MLPDFEELLQKYAELVIEVGPHVRPGQRLAIIALRTNGVPLEAAPLVRKLDVAAYQAGAQFVEVTWGDQEMRLQRFQHAPRDSFAAYPRGQAAALLEHIQAGDALLSISVPIPGYFNGQDPDLLALAEKTIQVENRVASSLLSSDATNWCVIVTALPAWAAVLFPDASPEAAQDRLWDIIFRICRVYEPDPVAAWRTHLQRLAGWARHLNERRYAALRFRGPGTDLTVGLADGHNWKSGGSRAANGIDFVANMPTEEVFTMPHRGRVDGVVRATMPLNYGGDLVEDFSLEFARGRVTAFRAGKGESALASLVSMDEGAACLGEVALVPHSSPIAQTGMLFFNTLLDENASSHLALGRSYRSTLVDGAGLSDEVCWNAGANQSLVHVDFMIGSGDMDVDGLTTVGGAEPVMRGGEWSFAA